jgi:hypothetical protein
MLSALSHKDDYDWLAVSYTCRRCDHDGCATRRKNRAVRRGNSPALQKVRTRRKVRTRVARLSRRRNRK